MQNDEGFMAGAGGAEPVRDVGLPTRPHRIPDDAYPLLPDLQSVDS